MKRYPAQQTSIHTEKMHICGLQVGPSKQAVSLRARLHPGFGMVVLKKDGAVIRSDFGAESWAKEPTLQTYENIAKKESGSAWTLEVHGPMTGFVLERVTGGWIVSESLKGFA